MQVQGNENHDELEEIQQRLKEAIRLFPGPAPGSERLALSETVTDEAWEGGLKKVTVQNTVVPELIPFPAAAPDGCGTAVIIIPGGGYRRQVLNLEGTQIAEWLNTLGITAFVLKHRLPLDAHDNPCDVPLADVLRAVRVVRSRAAQFRICPERIGVMGFSAGGHVASMAATCFGKEVYGPLDAVDSESARPDFCVLGYPAISYEVFAKSPESRQENAKHLVEMFARYSTEKLVLPETPPVFLFETDDDRTTDAEHSTAFYLAARQAGVTAELHIFRQGSHGFGLGRTRQQVSLWQPLLTAWLKSLGLLETGPAAGRPEEAR